MSGPKRFEEAKINVDTGAAVNICPLNLGPDGTGYFIEQPVVGECTPDGGAWQFQGYDESGLCRFLNGRPTGVHEVLCSAGEIARKDIKISVWDPTVGS